MHPSVNLLNPCHLWSNLIVAYEMLHFSLPNSILSKDFFQINFLFKKSQKLLNPNLSCLRKLPRVRKAVF